MQAPSKYDAETRARAVRMYYDRIRDHDDSKLAGQHQRPDVSSPRVIDRA